MEIIGTAWLNKLKQNVVMDEAHYLKKKFRKFFSIFISRYTHNCFRSLISLSNKSGKFNL